MFLSKLSDFFWLLIFKNREWKLGIEKLQINFQLLRPAGIGHGVQFPFVRNTQKHWKKERNWKIANLINLIKNQFYFKL